MGYSGGLWRKLSRSRGVDEAWIALDYCIAGARLVAFAWRQLVGIDALETSSMIQHEM